MEVLATTNATQEGDGSGGGDDMYLKAAEGKINNDWKLDEPMDFWRFRKKLANSMLRYKPSARKYPGDERMRPSTQQSL